MKDMEEADVNMDMEGQPHAMRVMGGQYTTVGAVAVASASAFAREDALCMRGDVVAKVKKIRRHVVSCK
ncbi:hypothetical protein P3X46_009020 [Hevea brasiliensis]|uniref:Uncharacterized protein n=1 Tax=Hevea brasiliensis TaxID=3981 RepID=A0ABQ9MKM7_HEVBR|nr:hypothetical protein P3X46_009020 [Hevea brasiliensis]